MKLVMHIDMLVVNLVLELPLSNDRLCEVFAYVTYVCIWV